MKNVRSSQPCISMSFCTEFSKAQVFPCQYPCQQLTGLKWCIFKETFRHNPWPKFLIKKEEDVAHVVYILYSHQYCNCKNYILV